MPSAPHAPKMANAWLCSMRPTLLHFGTSLALSISSSPAPSQKRVRTLPQLTNAGCGHHQLGRVILELALMVHRLVFTCVVNDRRPSLQCTPLATTSGPGRVCELFPSCQGQRSRLPGKGSYASTKFFKENSTSARTTQTISYELTVWLGTRLTQALLLG